MGTTASKKDKKMNSSKLNKTSTTPKVTKHSVCIIGGGVSGLYTALNLYRGGVRDIKVFEGRSAVGGRVKTTRNKEKEPLYNDFAWRVSEGNKRMIALAKELNIELKEQYTPSVGAPHSGEAKPALPGRAPLSVYATRSLESTAAADEADRESGYAGRIAQIAFPGESHSSKNYVVANGMNEYVTQIAALLPKGMVQVGHRCTDVRRTDDGNYAVDLVTRNGNSFTVEATTIVLAAPPCSLRQFSVARQGLNPALFAVHERRLGHVYAKCTPHPDVPDTSGDSSRIYRSVPESVLQQVISGDYGNSIFQAGYACDRFERVWRELEYQGPQVMREEVVAQLDKLKETILPELKNVHIEEVFLKIGFVHRWHIEAHVNGKTKEQLSRQAVYPNPVLLPKLHLVGEAFSADQGWTEGALATAEQCAAIILAKDDTAVAKIASPFSVPVSSRDSLGKDEMSYMGLVVDISEWPERHPGGTGPIKGHAGKDMSTIFDMYHGGWPEALATLFGLQSGTLDSSTEK